MDSKHNLNSGWLIAIDPDKKADAISSIKSSTTALRQLKLFLEHEIRMLDHTDSKDYETPSWPYKQADRLGQLRALRKVLSLVP